MTFVIAILLFICLGQFLYLRLLHKQLREWLDDLKGVHKNPNQKLFIRKNGILSDITFELNDILKENQEQVMQLKKADAANRQILTNLSHDIRTPLASLLGYLEALNHDLADHPKEYIDISYQKALALKSFIDMLFEWCKITSGEQQYQRLPEDINELTREIIIDWLPILDKKHITLKADISDDKWLISIDQLAYKRILNNLIQNAIYHGKCSQIAVQIKREAERIRIHILNNGMAIPQNKLPFIFERLYKCDFARSDAGSGLGLTITKELVLAMNGTIAVESSDTDGTEFVLFFVL